MLVKAIEGSRCPREENPRSYITDTEAVEVPASSYYQRLVAEGSLEIAEGSGLGVRGKTLKDLPPQP